jgi:hypothetical protein
MKKGSFSGGNSTKEDNWPLTGPSLTTYNTNPYTRKHKGFLILLYLIGALE